MSKVKNNKKTHTLHPEKKQTEPIAGALITPTPSELEPAETGRMALYLPYILLALCLLSIALLRYRLIGIPLERDEGEFAYIGKLILEGIPPFREAYDQKLPGVYFMYALFMGLFGISAEGIHTGLICLNLLNMFFLFGVGQKVADSWVGLGAAAIYGLITATPAVTGTSAHATNFVVLFVLPGLWAFLHGLEKKNIFWLAGSGLLLGLGFIMKQPGAFFVVMTVLLLFLHQLKFKTWSWGKWFLTTFLHGFMSLVPFFIVLGLMQYWGVFDKFWFWTFEYALAYGIPIEEAWVNFSDSVKEITKVFGAFWALAALGLGALYFTPIKLEKKWFVIGLAFFGFLAISPGYIYRDHYFILWLPAIAILAALFLGLIAEKLKKIYSSFSYLAGAIFCFITIQGIAQEKKYFFRMQPNEISRKIFGLNPFVESPIIAKYLQKNTTPQDKIIIIGSEPQIYVYADRKAASGYIFTYGLVDGSRYNKPMLEEMMQEIRKNKPKFIVYCNIPTSWGMQVVESKSYLMERLTQYVNENYRLVGLFDIMQDGTLVEKWGQEAFTHQSPNGLFFHILERNK
jgi:hypothetical protein